MVTVLDDGITTVDETWKRVLDVANALEAVLCERAEVLRELSRLTQGPETPTSVAEQTKLRSYLARLINRQEDLLAELQTLLPPEGKPLT